MIVEVSENFFVAEDAERHTPSLSRPQAEKEPIHVSVLRACSCGCHKLIIAFPAYPRGLPTTRDRLFTPRLFDVEIPG
jgi:hypothetical protein